MARARGFGRRLLVRGDRLAVDAALVVVSRPGDTILTTDADDIEHLVAYAGIDVTIVRV